MRCLMETMTRPGRLALLAGLAILLAGGPARAEGTLRIAEQFGLTYLPLHVIRDRGLIEKHAGEEGIEVAVEWRKLSGGAALNDALLSGSIDVAAGGVAPLLTAWDRTRSNYEVKAIAALASMPMVLTTINPKVRAIADFTEGDRIAVPAVGVSIQARVLQMAAAAQWGPDAFNRLDRFTVGVPHPDATAAMLAGGTEINNHFTTSPFYNQQLRDPEVRKVLDSFEVLGGPHSLNVLWATSAYRADNPLTYKVFFEALGEAMELIAADRPAAAEAFIRVEKSKLDPAFVREIVEDPQNTYVLTPQNTQKFADFMFKIGAIRTQPASWQDYFFPEVHAEAGS